MVAILRNSTGIPFGMTTPRLALEEMIRSNKRKSGQEFLVKRLKAIGKHLGKCQLPHCPVPVLDMPLREAELEAVIDEAWKTLQARDTTADFLRSLPAQGNA